MNPVQLLESGRFIGEEFILWLWFMGLTQGGQSGVDGDSSACFVDDAVALVTDHGEVQSLRLAKGNPAECREAFEALSRGMRPASAKIRLLSGDLEWTCTIQATDLVPRGLKLPPTQARDEYSRLCDRSFLVTEFYLHLDRRFSAFLQVDRLQLEESLSDWVQSCLEVSHV